MDMFCSSVDFDGLLPTLGFTEQNLYALYVFLPRFSDIYLCACIIASLHFSKHHSCCSFFPFYLALSCYCHYDFALCSWTVASFWLVSYLLFLIFEWCNCCWIPLMIMFCVKLWDALTGILDDHLSWWMICLMSCLCVMMVVVIEIFIVNVVWLCLG